MNPNLCRIVLRPRDPLEVFDLALLLLRARFGAFARLWWVLVAPWLLPAFALGWWTDWHWGVGLGLVVVLSALDVPFVLLAGRLLFDDRVRVRQVLWELVRGPGAVLHGVAVHGAVWVGGALTCGFGLPVFLGAAAFLPTVLWLERLAGARAMRRTSRLSAIGLAQAAAAGLAPVVLPIWFALLAEAVGVGVFDYVLQLGRPVGEVWAMQATPFAMIGVAIAAPLVGVYRLLLYVDARTRAEGWDLQVDLRALGLAK